MANILIDIPDEFEASGRYFACLEMFFYCNQCIGKTRRPGTATRLDEPEYQWAARLECPTCGCKFLLCRICREHNLYKNASKMIHMSKISDLKRHATRVSHKKAFEQWRSLQLQSPPGNTESICRKRSFSDMSTEGVHEAACDVFPDEPENNVSFPIDDKSESSSTTDRHNEFYSHNPSESSSFDEDLDGSEAGAEESVPSTGTTVPNWMERLTNDSLTVAPDFSVLFPAVGHSSSWYYQRQNEGRFRGAQCLVGQAFHGNENFLVSPCTALWGLMFARLNFGKPRTIFPAPYTLVASRHELNVHHWEEFDLTKPSNAKVSDCGKSCLRIECVRHLLGHGREVQPLFPGETVFARSPRGKELLSSEYVTRHDASTTGQSNLPNVVVLPLIIWADDIDPSNVKQNRQPVFVCNATIAIPEKDNHRSSNTFPIIIGPGHVEHTKVERILQSELKQLSEGIKVYCAASRTAVHVVGLVYIHLADRPAKAEGTRTLSGTSPTHACFGYCGVLPDNLPSCPECQSKRLKYPTIAGNKTTGDADEDDNVSSNGCTSCRDWVLQGAHYPSPPDYPGGPCILQVKPITFESLQEATRKVQDGVATAGWSKGAARAFLRTEGIPSSLADEIYDHASVRIPYYMAVDKDAFLAGDSKPRSYYEEDFPNPPTWSHPTVEIGEWVTAIMHQIFLGVVKATIGDDFLRSWLKTNKKSTAFTKRFNGSVDAASYLLLSWLKLQPLSATGEYGRFVSENYIALARIVKWLFSSLGSVQATDEEYADPEDKEILEYRVDELKAWLKARRIGFPSKLNKGDLLSLVLDAINRNNGNVPAIVPPERQESTQQQAEELVMALLAMCSRIMTKGDITKESADDTERHIKIFLSLVDKFDKGRSSPSGRKEASTSLTSAPPTTEVNKHPVWIRKYNFITLLDIPRCQLRFGSPRLYWEGDGKGEGSLGKIKEAIKSLKGKWALRATERWYRQRSLAFVTETLVNELQADGNSNPLVAGAQRTLGMGGKRRAKDEANKNYHVYKNAATAAKVFSDARSILSVVFMTDGTFGMVVKGEKRNGDSLIPLEFERDGNGVPINKSLCGASFFTWRVKVDVTCPLFQGGRSISKFCVMLPRHKRKVDEVHTDFYLITSNWEELLSDGSIGLPRASGCSYL